MEFHQTLPTHMLLPFVILNALCLCIDSAYAGPQLLLKQSDTLLTQLLDTLNICVKKFDAKIFFFDKMIAL